MPNIPKDIIQGKITNKSAAPIKGLTVKAFYLDFKPSEKPLGIPSQTDVNGNYKITYTNNDLNMDKTKQSEVNIFLKFYDENNNSLGKSRPFQNENQKIVRNYTLDYQDTSFLFNPNILNKRVTDINKLDTNKKKTVNNILNVALKDKLVSSAGDHKHTLKKVFNEKNLNYENAMDLNLTDFFQKFIIPDANKQKIPDTEIKAIQTSFEKEFSGTATIKDILQLNVPIKKNPIMKKEFRKVQSNAFGKIVGLKADQIKKLRSYDIAWDDVNNASLFPLVKEGTLTESEKNDLLVAADLSRLTGDNLELIKALKTPQLKTLENLVSWETKDWVRLIKDNKITVPENEDSVASYVENIRHNIEKTYPSQYFFKRILKDNCNEQFKLLKTVEKLQPNNQTIIGNSIKPESLNWIGISAMSRKEMEKDLNELLRFSNMYRDIGVPEIVNNSALNISEKTTAIEKRFNALNQFMDNNPWFDLYHSNLLENPQDYDWKNIDDDDQKYVRKQLLTYQRVQTLSDDYKTSDILLKNGFYSAMSIASIPEAQFVQKTGLDYETSRIIYLNSMDIATKTSHMTEAIRDASFGIFKDFHVSNQSSFVNDLKDIDGFDDLFGNQDYCDCEHCRSILSPAAYFTDLMYFIQKNISDNLSKKLLNSELSDHPLYLKNRRPDLWTLKLSCKNTSTEMPYLQIVNEVLCAYIQKAQSPDDVFELISNSHNSTSLPINVPLETLRLYLSHFNITLYDIYKTLRQPYKDQLREKLHLSANELEIIMSANQEQAKGRFGNEPLENMDVQVFLNYAKIDRETLEDLLKTKLFDSQIFNVKVALINKDTDDIQQYSEILKNLNETNLDMIHRYLRLWKKTHWTIREFDLLLNSLDIKYLNEEASGIPKILMLAELEIIQQELKLSPEELASITADILLVPVKENQKNLFERLFDLDQNIGDAYGTQIYSIPFVIAGLGISESELELLLNYLDTSDTPSELNYSKISQLFRHCRIARGLKCSITDLIGAMQLLFGNNSIHQLEDVLKLIEFNKWIKKSPLSISDLLFILNIGETTTKKFESNNSSTELAILEIQKAPEPNKEKLLFLHLQQLFNLTSDKLKKVLYEIIAGFNNAITQAFNASFDDTDQPIHLNNFDTLTNLMITQILNIPRDDSDNDSETLTSSEIIQALKALFNDETKLLIIQTLNVSLDGTSNDTENDSSNEIVDESSNETDQPFNLDDFDTLSELQVSQALKSVFNDTAQSVNLNDILIAIVFNKPLSASFDNNGQPVNSNDFVVLFELMKSIECLTFLFEKLEFSHEAVILFITHKDLFGMFDIKELNMNIIKRALYYQTLVSNADQEQEIEIQNGLINYLESEKSLPEFALKLWSQPLSQLESLSNAFISAESSLTEPANSLDTLMYLWELNELSNFLGLNGNNLAKFKVSNYSDVLIAKNVALGAFSAKYSDEIVCKEKLEPYMDKINSIKRDALCDYILGLKDRFKFQDKSDLYSFFLLDVNMSSCFRTSRIVSAISSLQLYIHRCLNNLECSDEYLNPLIENVKVIPTYIPIKEWEWRKNYRVWEANRKVFLYPENYIDPTLRTNKTHIFKELEDELLQQKITQESAEAAYKKYLAQFSELTKLRFAGAYYHSVPVENRSMKTGDKASDGFFSLAGTYKSNETEDSVYYLFARTNVDPYQYYYRIYNHYKGYWGNWIKMDVAIEADEISALVFRGKLYVFWTEVQTKEMNNISDGSSESNGVIFKVYTKYSFMNENGKWSVPQRVYIGYMFAEEDGVFLRAINSYPNKKKEREKKHDFVFDKFETNVFRKPYATIIESAESPISLSYIWTQGKGFKNTVFSIDSNEHTEKSKDSDVIDISFETPKVIFRVYNDQFSNIEKDIKGIIKFKKGNRVISDMEVNNIKVFLISSGYCTFKFGDYNWHSSNITTKELSHPITVSEFKLSFSKNQIINISESEVSNAATVLDQSNSHYPSENEKHFLQEEYEIVFTDNIRFNRYIENGQKTFTSLSRKLTQSLSGDGLLHIQRNRRRHDVVATTTFLTDELMDILCAKGLEQFLSLQTQKLVNNSGQQLDMDGPYGEYYWEMFFHIPYLIANHLNANHKYKEAKWWYERIFNPTSEEEPGSQKPSDHNWQFREFRNLDIEKLKDMMTNEACIEEYKKDPFNPHAIAKLRTNAYQKAIVMKYIDNLIDWGDYLFTQDTRESINEALMLYQLAYDILGKRPIKLGKCETADENTHTYENLKGFNNENSEDVSEFLIALENYCFVTKQDYLNNIQPVVVSKHLQTILQNDNRLDAPKKLSQISKFAKNKRLSDYFQVTPKQEQTNSIRAFSKMTNATKGMFGRRVNNYDDIISANSHIENIKATWADISQVPEKSIVENKPWKVPALEMVKDSVLVFCVPNNSDILDYWDRVEDRLYKIRHCMNISGVRRSLSLFQPPIDPSLLVRARAAGLSMDAILSLANNSKPLPPYRFVFLIEKAKQFAQTVQSFGNSLLSAMEKKDVEELTLLRSVHEQNILKLTKDIKKKQLKEAQHQYNSIQESLKNVQNRINYYQGLIDTDLITWETVQQVARHTGTGLRSISSIFYSTSGITKLLPQLGSPFALKWGGVEIGGSTESWGTFMNTLASIADDVAASAGLEASFQRRSEEWENQLTLATQEEAQVKQQLLAAEIRQNIAEKDIEIHEKSIEQTKEIHQFYKDKFTNLGLYNYLCANLGRMYRQAYMIALDMARSAEQTYQFEQDDNSFFIAGDNWEPDKAGLLSGERLLLQLQQLEQAFIMGNKRKPEITQTFSLAMLDPEQLIYLRQTGTCDIKIPEIAFEMLYPGQYKRIIKSVRLSIPCVVGPYTNVSAKLTLSQGYVRKDDNIDYTNYKKADDSNIAKGTSIYLSGSVNDAGMFDFNIRDERYLPFEGAGAISDWKLELPSTIRAFNYDTISDVLLTISYTALEGNFEAAEKGLTKMLSKFAAETEKGLFLFLSFKHDFPNAFHKLFNSQAGSNQSTEFFLEPSHFPYFLHDKTLNIKMTRIYLKPQSNKEITLPVSFKVNNSQVTITENAETTEEDIKKIGNIIGGRVDDMSGSPINKWVIEKINGLSNDEIDDILILIKYQIQKES